MGNLREADFCPGTIFGLPVLANERPRAHRDGDDKKRDDSGVYFSTTGMRRWNLSNLRKESDTYDFDR